MAATSNSAVAFVRRLGVPTALSMFVVIRRFPVQWVQMRAESFVRSWTERWQNQGRRRFLQPSFWIAALTWRAPDLCCRWLVWAVSNPKPKTQETVPVPPTIGTAHTAPGAL